MGGEDPINPDSGVSTPMPSFCLMCTSTSDLKGIFDLAWTGGSFVRSLSQETVTDAGSHLDVDVIDLARSCKKLSKFCSALLYIEKKFSRTSSAKTPCKKISRTCSQVAPGTNSSRGVLLHTVLDEGT